jgi:hypothetical protein
MIRTMIRTALLLAILALVASARPALADQPVLFHVSGDGVFNPANIGTPRGGSAGVVLGDGSGLAAYTASGTDFVLGDVDYGALGHGSNTHLGAAQSTTTGTVNGGIIKWPVSVAPNPFVGGSPSIHVTRTELGDIYFSYNGRFLLDPATGVITGEANFRVVGGTGTFEKASGLVAVTATSTGPPSPGVPFHYEFDGFVNLKK